MKVAHCAMSGLLVVALSGCGGAPAGDYVEQGRPVQNRADGVLFNQQHVDVVTRWRPPMDHGGTEQADRIAYRLWQLRFDADDVTATTLQVSHVWQRGWMGIGSDPERLQDPSFLRVGTRYVPNGCSGAALADVDSSGTTCQAANATPQVQQIGGRRENLVVTGTTIRFADGLDGRPAPCTLDLKQIAADADQPLTVSISAGNAMLNETDSLGYQTGRGYRFAVSYLPPGGAMIIDYGRPNWPIWRATCAGFAPAGQVLPLPDGLIRAGSQANPNGVRVLDMVADPGRTRPALFLAVPDGDYGYRLTVLREGRAPHIIPYFCHDCLPEIGGFFRSDPNWLLFDASLRGEDGVMTIGLTLFDVTGNRVVTRSYRFTDPHPWSNR